MSDINDGGPAFPTTKPLDSWGDPNAGMTLRDYAAIHSTQPGISETVAMAGLFWRVGRVWSDETTCLGSFDEWWESMTLERRCDLSALVRYAQADAMLKARAA